MGGCVVIRENGIFDMRDMTGRVQCVALPSRAEAIEKLNLFDLNGF